MGDKTNKCQNCDAELLGQFCHECGQKHQAHKHSFGYLMMHFIGDFFHFDAQFFNTMKPLFTKPGLVPLDYIQGKRKKHLDPIKMYVFVSIVFFALFFSVVKVNEIGKKGNAITFNVNNGTEQQIDSIVTDSIPKVNLDTILDGKLLAKLRENDSILTQMRGNLSSIENSAIINTEEVLVDFQEEVLQLPDSIQTVDLSKAKDTIQVSDKDKNMTVKEYEDWQQSLPKEERHGFVKYKIKKKVFEISEAGQQNNSNYFYKVFQSFVVALPKMIFVLLPIFALLFKVLYVRLKIFYVDHIVFTVYFFSFFYILFSIGSLIILIEDIVLSGSTNDSSVSDFFMSIASFWVFGYLLFAMKRFYGQSWMKTTVKYFIFLFLSFFISLIGFSLGFVVTLFFT